MLEKILPLKFTIRIIILKNSIRNLKHTQILENVAMSSNPVIKKKEKTLYEYILNIRYCYSNSQLK